MAAKIHQKPRRGQASTNVDLNATGRIDREILADVMGS